MSRTFVFWIGLSLVFAQVTCSSSRPRHEVYWNTYASPKLLVENYDEFVLHVKIGEFLDILCPQRSLMGITNGPKEPALFNLYNVTKENYLKCHHGDKKGKNFIFACNKPERENKLTIKFQTISPSPLGFRFQYCAEYYFVALSNYHENPGCIKNSTRIRIVVQCKDKPRPTKTPQKANTTTTIPRTTIKSTTQRKTDDPPFVHPPLQRPTKNVSVLFTGAQKQQKPKEHNDGRGACGHVMPSLWRILTFSFSALTVTNIVRQVA